MPKEKSVTVFYALLALNMDPVYSHYVPFVDR